ncbi:NAD(P)H-hydrate dehydratase [Sphingomonas jatrophae]|uniref:ADP-dependent (S)-NAD(P)H-hydrate dehydratase n=1 Tax=Sphingomonas jatrophae TaxID=1166337 RepID=A0A1I6LB54_9SPHN|nr:NAD(P)H-hydrate dehydratase [Sphingomonas jatrophae]SFS00712.1 yjeF C-terminal region, hydroxyethylthiazole kinase-related [Sphingomonas jatrophae]
MTPLDRAWLDSNPLPDCDSATDKNSRGRVLLAGGSALCPGALRLTAEAALRAGAGKVRAGTIDQAAIGLGLLLPECAVLALPADEDGELAEAAAEPLRAGLGRCDVLALGPGMGSRDAAGRLVRALLADPPEGPALLLDAAAISCLGECGGTLDRWHGRIVLTPHFGEMAALTGEDEDAIGADPARHACEAAARLGAVVVLKSARTVIAAPDGETLHYEGGGSGLATGGSGDVLAGVIAGLLARGAAPLLAAAWGVWLHGEAGRRVSARLGPIGLLARELPGEVPTLMAGR